MSESNHVGLWNRCLDIIRDNVPESTFKTWFVPIVPLKYEDRTLIVQVPSQFFYEFLEDKFVDLLRKTLYKVIGDGTKLMYNVMVDRTSIPNQTVNLEASNRSMAIPQKSVIRGGGNKAPSILQAPAPQDLDPHLNPDYNFENFIEGYSNKLSRSVAEAVAQSPAKTVFNPLFLHGASGVGKTHLANAIGTRIKELYPGKRVLYVSAHLFQVQYTDSVRNNTTNDFINFYQTIDVLIIDDIQEFAGVTKTQNTFFHIFNHLHQNGKQLILTSDRAPVLLQGMEERLLTRFKWGMVAELERPTVELRKNILRNKIHRDGLEFPTEVIEYIAENVNESVRDLEGIVISIMAHSTIYNKDINLDLAQRIVRKVVRNEARSINIDDIINTVCKHFSLETVAIHTKSRKREVVQARQVAMYLAKAHTDFSTSKIGKFIGNKDHATVLHACKTVKGQCEVDKAFRAEIENIQSLLKNKGANL
ncbi:chromosomal replication initiator protein DnaA [Bacteroides sp.]|uniref:chromosomal replication initiator protein DnaA n=1 Tax=Bacteroides sp. TaxID=29523 RepID=UPI001B678DC5|nr:chromosomal replication initiator protein DnaA [Bacteroides sp.]MBP6068180.1 chromosomal replication initiator protein DnaA [Bacteroides sp.]MBP6936127.1 chromosomal replication initiator protein DnaA [Bacteroides sp.]MBP9585589.1 chromosomal replication initiator protein DnaA [Bacteroides sp.]